MKHVQCGLVYFQEHTIEYLQQPEKRMKTRELKYQLHFITLLQLPIPEIRDSIRILPVSNEEAAKSS